eukprot:11178648-Lingulodinium_polyedra.AAC.1
MHRPDRVCLPPFAPERPGAARWGQTQWPTHCPRPGSPAGFQIPWQSAATHLRPPTCATLPE